jgi:glycosyltransferase involved in cell wall biosynthesis
MNQPTNVKNDVRADEDSVPRVTIAIPVYNGASFLLQTIESILSQTYPHFELILCDNASTDATAEICQSFVARDARVRYHRNDSNIGWAGNHNRAVELARGTYFKWAAYDDLLEPTFIEKCVQVLDENPDVALCYPQTQFIDEIGTPLGIYADGLDLKHSTANQRFRAFFKHQSLSHPVFGVARTHILARTGRMGSYVMSDRVLIGEMALNGKLHELPEPLFLRRLHNGISTNINSTGVQMLAWIDPSQNKRFHFPKWRRLYEYFRAIQRTKMSVGERVGCFRELVRFLFVPQRWAGLASEVIHILAPHKESSWMK